MNFPDPKSLILKWRATRVFSKMGLGQLINTIQDLESEIAGLEKAQARFTSPEWIWLTEVFFPLEIRRIEHERSSIPPDDAGKQAIVQGQINEILHLQEILINANMTLEMLRTQLKLGRETEAKLRQRSNKT